MATETTLAEPTLLQTRAGAPKLVRVHDPLWDRLTGRRVRYAGVAPDGRVVVRDNNDGEGSWVLSPDRVWAY
jgi:hypothetical protein